MAYFLDFVEPFFFHMFILAKGWFINYKFLKYFFVKIQRFQREKGAKNSVNKVLFTEADFFLWEVLYLGYQFTNNVFDVINCDCFT